MRLYSLQPLFVYEQLAKGEPFRSAPVFDAEPGEVWGFKQSYDWLASQMRVRLPAPAVEVDYPVWAYRLIEGQEGKGPDWRHSSWRSWARNSKAIVELTLDVPDDLVLVSDYDAWHAVLNGWLLGDEAQVDSFNDRVRAAMGRAYQPPCDLPAELREQLEASWLRIFDLPYSARWSDEEYSGCGFGRRQTLQATFWEIRPEYVVKARRFDGVGRQQTLAVFREHAKAGLAGR